MNRDTRLKAVLLKTDGGNPAPDQKVVIDDISMVQTFFSYGSKIAELTSQQGFAYTIVLYPLWCYSRTTMKYFWKFLEEYADIKTNKKSFEKIH